MKKIRITEEDLNQIVKGATCKILSEGAGWEMIKRVTKRSLPKLLKGQKYNLGQNIVDGFKSPSNDKEERIWDEKGNLTDYGRGRYKAEAPKANNNASSNTSSNTNNSQTNP